MPVVLSLNFHVKRTKVYKFQASRSTHKKFCHIDRIESIYEELELFREQVPGWFIVSPNIRPSVKEMGSSYLAVHRKDTASSEKEFTFGPPGAS